MNPLYEAGSIPSFDHLTIIIVQFSAKMSPPLPHGKVWDFDVNFKKVWGKVWDAALHKKNYRRCDYMTKKCFRFVALFLACMLLAGCGPIGDKAASLSIVYSATTVFSLLTLVCYCSLVRKKEVWFLLLFSSVLVVNIGYLTLSLSKTLDEALLANRISYLGSVFLPMSMLMIILNTTWIRHPRWLSGLLLCIGIIVFLVAASPGYFSIYYKEVTLEFRNGVSMLQKVYGPWHCLYLFYLLTYFCSMVTVIIYATAKDKIDSPIQAVILAIAVFVNIGVWLIEQLVQIDFEILSVSYIISELFLLSLNIIMQENMRLRQLMSEQAASTTKIPEAAQMADSEDLTAKAEDSLLSEQISLFTEGLKDLTQTERMIYEFYIEGKTTKEIMATLNIKENTLKFHNKNLYSKLSVSSRKQLMEIYKHTKKDDNSI